MYEKNESIASISALLNERSSRVAGMIDLAVIGKYSRIRAQDASVNSKRLNTFQI